MACVCALRFFFLLVVVTGGFGVFFCGCVGLGVDGSEAGNAALSIFGFSLLLRLLLLLLLLLVALLLLLHLLLLALLLLLVRLLLPLLPP